MVDWLALIVAIIALGLTLFQYWRTDISPFSLTVMPPVVTQVNDSYPSLIVDLAISNSGGQEAVLSDVTIHLLTYSENSGISLHVQSVLNRESPYGSLHPLDAEKTFSSNFLPVLIKGKETVLLRLLCAPYMSELAVLKEKNVLSTNGIAIDLCVNGITRQNVFILGYRDFCEKFKGDGIVEIPEGGFTPRWYREEKPVTIKGTLW